MKSLIAFILLFSTNLYAGSCRTVQVRIIFDGRPVVTKEILCSKKTSGNMLFYVSKSCNDNKCAILKKRKAPLEIKNYFSNIGSPGFKLCSELGGVPQIFEFTKDSNLWESTERCLFNSSDFVEISLLTLEWKSFINQ